MKNATVSNPAMINEFELIQACADFEKKNPNTLYDVRPGNDCIWISTTLLNLYYIFRDGKIADIQVD